MMTVAAHIAEWFNPGTLIIRNKYGWRIMKYMFSIIEKKGLHCSHTAFQ